MAARDEAQPTARLLIAALRSFEEDLQARLVADGWTDVSVAHTNTLRHLDPEGMQMHALARDAGVTKQAVTQSVRTLVERGLVEVVPDPDDGRARRVVYTERGRRLVRAAIGHIRAIEAAWAQTLGEDGYRGLRAGLARLGPSD